MVFQDGEFMMPNPVLDRLVDQPEAMPPSCSPSEARERRSQAAATLMRKRAGNGRPR